MTALLIWVVRVIVLLLIIRLIVHGVRSVMRQPQVPRPKRRVPERAEGTLVRDPQCGTYIPAARALVVGTGPDALHFCSTTCRDAWTAAHGRARAKA